MASSKVMASSKPRNSDLSSSSSRSRRAFATSTSPRPSTTKPPSQLLSHSQLPADLIIRSNNVHDLTPSTPSPPTMNVDGVLHNVYSTHSSSESTLLDAQITVIDNPAALPPQSVETSSNGVNNNNSSSGQDTGGASVFPQSSGKTVEEVWREIVAGRKVTKDEPDEMMTLEDFLAKAAAVDVGGGGGGGREEDEVKMPQPERLSGGVYAFDPVPQSAFQVLDNVEGSIIGFGNEVDVLAGGVGVGGGGRGKRGRAPALEPLDKAAQQRQRRMIKNRESAARSRERKQAYQVELESLAVRLEEENEQLLKEKEERTRERFKQLMEKVVPVVEKRKPPRVLRKIHSWRW